METYSLRDIQSMLGLSRAVVSGLIDAGFVTPQRGPRREYRFTFQDIVVLRTAHGLQAAKIPPRRIVQTLRRLRARLPAEMPLSGLRITAVGNEIAVHEGRTRWQADSGQLLMDFELQPGGGSVRRLSRTEPSAARVDWLARGASLEASDPAGAERSYRAAIAQDAERPDAYLNLGVLLAEHGRHDEAIGLYRQALLHCPDEPLLHFNLAVALEDAHRVPEARTRYEHCLRLSPDMADAHFTLARLHEQRGEGAQAIRHYSAYRRLQR